VKPTGYISYKKIDLETVLDKLLFKKWTSKKPPKRILVIRLQAMGDVIITLPYLQNLRNKLPKGTIIDFLTRDETASIPQNINLFNRVYVVRGERSFIKQLFFTCLLIPLLFWRRYEVVIDLQNNKLSHLVRRFLFPKAWALFDKFSPIFAGKRNQRTIDALEIVESELDFSIELKNTSLTRQLMDKYGISQPFIIINPAGFFETRNWQIEKYIELCKLIALQYPQMQFLVLGIAHIREKATVLEENLKGRCINLVEKTSPVEAFALVQQARLMISEDSGLLHFAFATGVPTLAILGSTRNDWMNPQLPHTLYLNSSDLECGNCMLSVCKHHDNHCLTRYSPAFVAEKAFELLQKTARP